MRIREVEAMIADNNLHLLSVDRRKHYKVRVRSQDGRECTVIFPVSESDHRARLNKQSQLRKFARG